MESEESEFLSLVFIKKKELDLCTSASEHRN